MALAICIVLFSVLMSTLAMPRSQESSSYNFPFITRSEWGANPPTGVAVLPTPVTHVVIHHSYEPGVCWTTDDCKAAMRSMQNYHQNGQGWADIGYNFAVGGDGGVYEGRGWQTVGAHAVGYNMLSIGICLIGNWVSALPPQVQLENTRRLIAAGVERGFISPNYRLIGHRQATATECPGDALFREISTWNNFSTA
ncbi:peptidoglycan-recognition protein LB-like [Achroia grisella]|uniref:peptidoglycan-recognition protein LB-like n=1 Tax=Achroia grisella TaxID=688607 RepID=UPI0027D2A28B|nr:peptidoglycan-recognition protein LB-like [Achroia grisella]